MEAIVAKEVRSRADRMQRGCFVGVLVLGWAWGTSPAQADLCQLPDNGSGTIDLPPTCPAGYSFPVSVIKLADGLPPGASLGIALNLTAFSGIVRTPGGVLGGESTEFDATGAVTITGMGRLNGISLGFELTTKVRMDFAPHTEFVEQNISGRLVSLEGTMSLPNVYFNAFTIRAGEEFGLPSPGWVKASLQRSGLCVGGELNGQPCAQEPDCPDSNYNGTCVGGTRNGSDCYSNATCPLGVCLNPGTCECDGLCPPPQFTVTSSFDISYEVEYAGKPGSALDRLEGMVSGTIPLQAGAIPTLYILPRGGDGREITVWSHHPITFDVYARDLAADALRSYEVCLPTRVFSSDGAAKLASEYNLPMINTLRPDWVFFGYSPMMATSLIPHPRLMAALIFAPQGVPPFEDPRYLGQFVYQPYFENDCQFHVDVVLPGLLTQLFRMTDDVDDYPIAFQHFDATVHVISPSCEGGCDDPWFCNGFESCVQGTCVSSGNPCTGGPLPFCNEDVDECFECGQHVQCNDENPCTLDLCDAGVCTHELLNTLTFKSAPGIRVAKTSASVLLGDMDGDEHLDAVAVNSDDDSVSVALGKGDGTFFTATAYATGNKPEGIALTDLDTDGDLDVVAVNSGEATFSILLNDGDGTLMGGADYMAGGGPLSVATADIDLDGDNDVGIAKYTGSAISVFLNMGDGSIQSSRTYSAPSHPAGLRFGDVDGDLLADMVYSTDGGINIRRNLGGGIFAANATVFTVAGFVWAIDVGDIDADGDEDVVAVHDAYTRSTWFSVALNDGSGAFDAITRYDIERQGRTVTLFDADMDGDLDAAIGTDWKYSILIAANEGRGDFGAPREYAFYRALLSVAAGDIEGDGLNDLVIALAGAKDLSVLRNSPSICNIEEMCYYAGNNSPDGACHFCVPTKSRYEWTFDEECAVATCETTFNVGMGVSYAASDVVEVDDDEAGCHPNANCDVWYLYTAECTGTHVVSTAGSTFVPVNDTVLSVYDECGGAEIACNDNKWPGLLSELTFSAVRGETYYIRVAGGYDSAGDVVLNIGTVGRCIRTAAPTPE